EGFAATGPFDVEIECPVDPAGYIPSHLGGPNEGGHQPPYWYIQYGMDLAAQPGTGVYAAFDGHVTVYHPHNPSSPPGVYGDQIFYRYTNDRMGCYYTHINEVPTHIRQGAQIRRGD